MYAVVDIKGFQYRLQKGDTLKVPAFDNEVGDKIELPEVLLVSDDDAVTVGAPVVDGAVVNATVTGQGKYNKIVIFKKKRRKDYSRKSGHRQMYTEITVDDILLSSPKKSAASAEEIKSKTASTAKETDKADTTESVSEE